MSAMDDIYKRMKDDIELLHDQDLRHSQIRQFFAGQTLFVTGVTGFMGKCLIEKLLRSCPEVKRIYVLIRQKRGLTVEAIIKKYFENPIFDLLRITTPNFGDKVTAIKGDLSQDQLGMSPENMRLLEREVNIILHVGGTVKFDENITIALRTNVLATRDMLDMAQRCDNLKVFMYMSTAYSHCHQKYIDEKFYSPPADMKMVYDIIAADTENERGITDEALDTLHGDWPNTYTFTKAIAEELVRKCGQTSKFTCGIYRPSIVIGIAREPVRGWTGNLNGPVAIIAFTSLGVVHTSHHYGYTIDFAPADMATNAFLAITWDSVERRKRESGTPIYNYGSSTIAPINLPDLHSYLYEEGRYAPPSRLLWKPFHIYARYYWLFFLFHVVLHGIPALLADGLMLLKGGKTKFVSIFLNMTKHGRKVSYFGNGNWRIRMPETIKVYDRMNEVDKDTFYYDLTDFDWRDYGHNFWHGIRTYALNDSVDTIPVSAKKMKWFYVLHYTSFALVIYLSFRLVWNLASSVLRLFI